MPADSSSPIPAALTALTHADPLQEAEPPHLLAYLAAVPDPRAARGRRHPVVAILGLAAAAVLASARSFAAIAEWAADAPQPVRGMDRPSAPARYLGEQAEELPEQAVDVRGKDRATTWQNAAQLHRFAARRRGRRPPHAPVVPVSAYTFTCRLAYGLTCRSAEAGVPVRLS